MHVVELRAELERATAALDSLGSSSRLAAGVRARVETATRCLAKASEHLTEVNSLLATAFEAPIASITAERHQAEPRIRPAHRGRPVNAARPAPLLTPRETEVATLLRRGFTNKQIAAELVISTATARVHVENIMAKLGVHSRGQVAIWATQHELLP